MVHVAGGSQLPDARAVHPTLGASFLRVLRARWLARAAARGCRAALGAAMESREGASCRAFVRAVPQPHQRQTAAAVAAAHAVHRPFALLAHAEQDGRARQDRGARRAARGRGAGVARRRTARVLRARARARACPPAIRAAALRHAIRQCAAPQRSPADLRLAIRVCRTGRVRRRRFLPERRG